MTSTASKIPISSVQGVCQEEVPEESGASSALLPAGSLEFDVEDYKPYLDGFDLTDEQAEELLHTLWQIMSRFVELGFGVDSVQILFPGIFEKAFEGESDPVDRNKGPTGSVFNVNAASHTEGKKKENEE